MSMWQSPPPTEAAELAEQREAVAGALASVRAGGLEPGPECRELLEAVAAGQLTTVEVIDRLRRRHRR